MNRRGELEWKVVDILKANSDKELNATQIAPIVRSYRQNVMIVLHRLLRQHRVKLRKGKHNVYLWRWVQ